MGSDCHRPRVQNVNAHPSASRSAPWRARLGLAIAAAAALTLAGCQTDVEFTRAPVQAAAELDERGPLTNVYVAAPVDGIALTNAVEEAVPSRIARIRRWIRRAACVERSGRKRCGNAKVEGNISRAGPVGFVADGRRLQLAVPISYTFELSGSGAGRSLSDTVIGRLEAIANYTVQLDSRGRPEVKRDGELVFRGGTDVQVFSDTTSIAREITRSLDRRLTRLAATFESALDTTPAEALLADAWRTLHFPVKLDVGGTLWLRGAPKGVHFAGLMGEGSGLSVRFGVETPMTTYRGERPVPLIPVAMPALKPEPGTEPGSRMAVAVSLPYTEISKRVAERVAEGSALPVAAAEAGATVTVGQARVYPAGKRLALAVGLEIDTGGWSAFAGEAHLVGVPQVAADPARLTLRLPQFTQPLSRPEFYHESTFLIEENTLAEAFAGAMDLDVDAVVGTSLEAFRDRLAVPLGSAVDLVGRFERVAFEAVVPGAEGLDAKVVLVGDMTIRKSAGASGNVAAAPGVGGASAN